MWLQVKAYGPGIEKSGCLVNQPAEFTVDAKDAGKGPLKITAQVRETQKTFLADTHKQKEKDEINGGDSFYFIKF